MERPGGRSSISRTSRRAFIAALEAPEDMVFNEAFNVGCTAHNYRMRDIAEIVADVVPGCRIELAPDAGPDKRSYRVSFDKIARVLPAFKPQWDARRGAEQLYAAYRQAGLTSRSSKGRAISASPYPAADGRRRSRARPAARRRRFSRCRP